MLHIEDNLTVERESDQVYWADKYSLRHVASSKYHADELSERSALEWRGKGTYCHIRRVDLRTGQVHFSRGEWIRREEVSAKGQVTALHLVH